MDRANGNQPGGPLLRERRLAAGLSQEKLAQAAECSTAMVKLLERGYAPSESAVLGRIHGALTKSSPAGRPSSTKTSGAGGRSDGA